MTRTTLDRPVEMNHSEPVSTPDAVHMRQSDSRKSAIRNRVARVWLWGFLSLAAAIAGWSVLQTGSQTDGQIVNGRRILTKPIEEIRVGDRILAENPTGHEDTSLGEFDPDAWRTITLRAEKTDGSYCDIVLLRPLWWLEDRVSERPVSDGTTADTQLPAGNEDEFTGRTIHISVPECGIHGDATIVEVSAAPIPAGSRGSLVTATFRHHSASVISITLKHDTSPIVTTPVHRFWSPDRQAFIRAEHLRAGDTLQSSVGSREVIASVRRLSETAAVFNLEVERDHVYHVGDSGLLVHNGTLTPIQFLEQVGFSNVKSIGIPANGGSPFPLPTTGEIVYALYDAQRGEWLKVGSTAGDSIPWRPQQYQEWVRIENRVWQDARWRDAGWNGRQLELFFQEVEQGASTLEKDFRNTIRNNFPEHELPWDFEDWQRTGRHRPKEFRGTSSRAPSLAEQGPPPKPC